MMMLCWVISVCISGLVCVRVCVCVCVCMCGMNESGTLSLPPLPSFLLLFCRDVHSGGNTTNSPEIFWETTHSVCVCVCVCGVCVRVCGTQREIPLWKEGGIKQAERYNYGNRAERERVEWPCTQRLFSSDHQTTRTIEDRNNQDHRGPEPSGPRRARTIRTIDH